jgi:hypothetical protein
VEGRSSTDTVTVTVGQASALPLAAVPGTQNGTPGIQLGSTFAPAWTPGGSNGATSGPGVQLVAVDLTSLELLENETYAPTAMAKLQSNVNALIDQSGATVLFAVAGLPGGKSVTGSQMAIINAALAQLGASPIPGISPGVFGVIGVAQQPPGSASQRIGAPLTGALLQSWDTANYGFTFTDQVAVDTRVPNPPAGVTNRMRVGTATYDATGTNGFQVVTLDRGTLTPIANAFHSTYGADAATGMGAMTEALQKAVADESLVLVSSVGIPFRAPAYQQALAPQWNNIVGELQALGASPDTLSRLGSGSADTYSFIGPAGTGWEVAEAGTLILSGDAPASPSGRIQGQLGRDAIGVYGPELTAYEGSPDFSITQTAFQAPQAWPFSAAAGASAAQQAAYAWVSQQLSPSFGSDVRASYGDQQQSGNWAGFALQASRLQCPSSGCPGFTPADLNAVTAELIKEFTNVSAVWDWSADLQGLFTATASNGAAQIEQIATGIQNAITTPPSSDGTAATVLGILGDILWLGSAASGASEELELGLGVVAGIVSLAADAASAGSAQPPTVQVQTDAANLAVAEADNLLASANEIYSLTSVIVSDYGKLNTVAPLVVGNGAWVLPSGVQGAIQAGLTQTAWESLMPIGYTAWKMLPTKKPKNPLPVDPKSYQCFLGPFLTSASFAPWAGADPDSYVSLYTPTSPPTFPTAYGLQAAGFTPGKSLTNQTQPPPASIVDPLFESIDASGGVGLYRSWFWEREMLPGAVLGCAGD